MSCFCLRYRKKTENLNPKAVKTSNYKTMLLSKCAICGSKKSRFMKKQEPSRKLSHLTLRTPLNKIPLLCNILF